MKKMLLASVLALAMVTVYQQHASAWGWEVKCSGGFNWHYSFGIHCGGCDHCVTPCYADGGCGSGAPGYDGYSWGGSSCSNDYYGWNAPAGMDYGYAQWFTPSPAYTP